jgi:hypothetical protein
MALIQTPESCSSSFPSLSYVCIGVVVDRTETVDSLMVIGMVLLFISNYINSIDPEITADAQS